MLSSREQNPFPIPPFKNIIKQFKKRRRGQLNTRTRVLEYTSVEETPLQWSDHNRRVILRNQQLVHRPQLVQKTQNRQKPSGFQRFPRF